MVLKSDLIVLSYVSFSDAILSKKFFQKCHILCIFFRRIECRPQFLPRVKFSSPKTTFSVIFLRKNRKVWLWAPGKRTEKIGEIFGSRKKLAFFPTNSPIYGLLCLRNYLRHQIVVFLLFFDQNSSKNLSNRLRMVIQCLGKILSQWFFIVFFPVQSNAVVRFSPRLWFRTKNRLFLVFNAKNSKK